jgi:hypothetical protein
MLRRADARFLLNDAPRSSVVIGALEGWREALGALSIEDVQEGSRVVPDLVVAQSMHARAAGARGAEAVILEGRRGRAELREAGYHVRRYLAVPSVAGAEFYIPLDQPAAARFAVERALPERRGWKSARNRMAGGLVAHGALPPVGPIVSVGQRHDGQPFLVAAAQQFGVEPDVRWFVQLGQQGDDYRRGAFLLFPRGGRIPRWVVKFSRVPGHSTPFDLEEQGLQLVTGAGAKVRASAPDLIGRFSVAGVDASVELAAPGKRLDYILDSHKSRRVKLRTIDAVTDWALALAQVRADQSVRDERLRSLATEVFPRWLPAVDAAMLETRLRRTRVVLQHQDLASYNVIVSGSAFTVLDWEGACADGFPLWDILHFMHDALSHLDGAVHPGDRRDQHAVRLFRGELESSAVLFRWLREAAAASGLEHDEVAALATALWLAIGSYFLDPQEQIPAFGSARHRGLPASARMASIWLNTPGLGLGWNSWLE